MSKSLGTGIDPMQLIEGGPRPPVFTEGGDFPAYGADAVRWGLLAISSSQDVRFNEERVAQGRQLANKLYNASRLVLLRVPEGAVLPDAAPAPATVEDALDPLAPAGREAPTWRAAIDDFDFHVAALRRLRLRLRRAVRLVPRAAQAAPVRGGQRRGGAFALHVLGETLALAHPLIPFVTEEIWSHVPGADGLLMARRYPEPDEALRDPAAEAQLARAIEAVQELRALARQRRRRSRAGRSRRGSTATGYEATRRPRGAARAAWSGPATAASPVATVGVPGGDGGGVRLRRRRPRGRAARARRRAARSSRPRSPAPRASSPTSASWPRRRRRSCRPSATSSRACGRSSRSFDLVRASAPRSTCSRSSCSACASGWSACGGC